MGGEEESPTNGAGVYISRQNLDAYFYLLLKKKKKKNACSGALTTPFLYLPKRKTKVWE